MADEARSRLGRGLASLIGDVGGEAAHHERPRAQRKVPIEFIKANPRNPRRDFSEAELGELADSIKQHGVIQPIVVRAVKGAADRYEIIAGCTRTATRSELPAPVRSQMASNFTVQPIALALAMSAAVTSPMPSR